MKKLRFKKSIYEFSATTFKIQVILFFILISQTHAQPEPTTCCYSEIINETKTQLCVDRIEDKTCQETINQWQALERQIVTDGANYRSEPNIIQRLIKFVLRFFV